MTADFFIIPGIIVIAGGLIMPAVPERLRPWLFLVFPAAALAVVFAVPEGRLVTASIAGMDLQPLAVDRLSRLFGIIFAATAFICGVYAWHVRDITQQVAALVYAGSALGVSFAGDFFSLFVFWELMAVSSTWLVWANRSPQSDKAGMRYLIYHIVGGGVLFSGILMHYSATGSLQVVSFEPVYSPAAVLMLIGVAVNAAVVPLHAWLPDAYPKATVTGAVFMSAFTTKSAVYVLLRVFPGWEVLTWFGCAMALYGVLYAVVCKDIREILAYHIISQVGFMVAGAGIGTEMAVNGAAAHAYSHILYKALLFMGTGAVLYKTGTTKVAYLGGLASRMRWVLILYMIGAFSISGLPLFNGFISKSITIAAAGEAHNEAAMIMLMLASVGTFLSVGLKLPYMTWFDREHNLMGLKRLPRNMYAGMGMAAFLCIFYGLVPGALYRYLPYPVEYNPFTVYHLVEVTQVSLMTFLGFWVFCHKFHSELILALDVDWFYRRPAPFFTKIFVTYVSAVFDRTEELAFGVVGRLRLAFRNPMTWLNPFTGHRHEAYKYSPTVEVVVGLVLFVFVLIEIILMV
jgi:multicomponent Na+:H+ antiporter subunit D